MKLLFFINSSGPTFFDGVVAAPAVWRFVRVLLGPHDAKSSLYGPGGPFFIALNIPVFTAFPTRSP